MTTRRETMLAYHGDVELKKATQKRLAAHAKADNFRQGFYWEDGKGCAVGCTVHDLAGTPIGELRNSGHSLYPEILGIPELLAHLEDRIFEGLPKKDSKTWPKRFIDAIPVGADLDGVWPQYALWLLVDPVAGVLQYAKKPEIVQAVADLYHRWIDGDKPPVEEWQKATRDADVAYYAAYANAAAAYAIAAHAANDDHAATATAAAYANAGNHYQLQAVKLINLLKAAPVSVP